VLLIEEWLENKNAISPQSLRREEKKTLLFFLCANSAQAPVKDDLAVLFSSRALAALPPDVRGVCDFP
jgi:hypothetical protein